MSFVICYLIGSSSNPCKSIVDNIIIIDELELVDSIHALTFTANHIMSLVSHVTEKN
jgi:hypothetical protein